MQMYAINEGMYIINFRDIYAYVMTVGLDLRYEIVLLEIVRAASNKCELTCDSCLVASDMVHQGCSY